MHRLRCDHCQQAVYFENRQCLHCGHLLAFLPDQFRIAALAPDADGHWQVAHGGSSPDAPNAPGEPRYRLCHHYLDTDTCNWAIEAQDDQALCVSCRLTTQIPDLSLPGRQAALQAMESAKRRLLYNLRELGLPVFPSETRTPLRFSFLEDAPQGQAPAVLTGHDHGHITINLAEANAVTRLQSRSQLGEPYRTVLGHFRHEIGHFYWDELVAPDAERLSACRALFGDDQQDYAQSLQRHYQQPAQDWEDQHISCYASAHPWEDWAETWAHYMHMQALLATAEAHEALPACEGLDFEQLVARWIELSLMLNALNRSLGLEDAYPFTLTHTVQDKLHFVHDTVRASAILA